VQTLGEGVPWPGAELSLAGGLGPVTQVRLDLGSIAPPAVDLTPQVAGWIT